MFVNYLVKAICAAFACCVVLAQALPASAEEALVAVATNFRSTAEELQTVFELDTDHSLKLTSGSTGMIYAQIVNGAPFDAFLSADAERPRLLEENGLGVAGSRFTYARGELILWRMSRPEMGDQLVEALKAGRLSKIAIANPDVAPYGRAATEVLTGIWGEGAPNAKLVFAENVAQAFSYVATGNVDAGFVARAQYMHWVSTVGGDHAGQYWDIPYASYTAVTQDAVLLKKGAENAAALAFMKFLQGDKARTIIAQAGYSDGQWRTLDGGR